MNSRLQKAEELIYSGRFAEAEKLCRSSLKLGRDMLRARRLLAICLYNQSATYLGHPSLYGEAERLLRECLVYSPDLPEALNNLGSLLLITQRPEEAVGILERLSGLPVAGIKELENLASAQHEAGFLSQAAETLRRLAVLNPSENAAYLLREALLAPAVPDSDDEIANLRDTARDKLVQLSERNGLALTDPLHYPSTYFRFTYHGQVNAELNRLIAGIYAKACPSLLWESPHVSSWKAPSGRIRIGIASRFLRAHSIGNTSRGFVEQLDRNCFEVIVIRLEPSTGDSLAEAIDRVADHVLTLNSGSLDDSRRAIAELKLDVLFYQDVGMEPFSYFLAFARLAPIQFTSFGHPDTTGIPTMDYFVSSEGYELPEAGQHYTETLVQLPGAGTLSYYHRPPRPAMLDRKSFGLPSDRTIYCCPQTLFKIQPVMDRLFADIVARDPLALIVLVAPPEAHWRKALEGRFRNHSAALAEHVRFLSSMPYEHFLALLSLSDVLLDTVPFNGQNTTLEAFSLGVPVVTLPGGRQCERHGYGLYQRLGFDELIAQSETHYAELAVRVATDATFRAHCVCAIEMAADRMFNDLELMRSFEHAVKDMVRVAVKAKSV